MVLPAGPLSALMQVFQLKDKLRFEKKTEKTQRGQKREETLYVVEHEAHLFEVMRSKRTKSRKQNQDTKPSPIFHSYPFPLLPQRPLVHSRALASEGGCAER